MRYPDRSESPAYKVQRRELRDKCVKLSQQYSRFAQGAHRESPPLFVVWRSALSDLLVPDQGLR